MMCQKLFALALFSMMQAVLMMQAERKVSPTICKHFPDADICKDPDIFALWQKTEAEEKLLPTICKLFPDADTCNKFLDRYI